MSVWIWNMSFTLRFTSIGYVLAHAPSIANLAPCSFSTLGMIINASDKIKTKRVDQHMQ